MTSPGKRSKKKKPKNSVVIICEHPEGILQFFFEFLDRDLNRVLVALDAPGWVIRVVVIALDLKDLQFVVPPHLRVDLGLRRDVLECDIF